MPFGDGILERMDKWVACWKKIYLAKGGRVTLTKSKFYFSYVFYVFISTSGWSSK
jgi:hypothetical protein